MKIGLLSLKVEEYNKDTNSKWLRANLDLLEYRECAAMKMASYHQKVVWYYNARVKGKEFRLEDLVL